jgi:hypothetical protein
VRGHPRADRLAVRPPTAVIRQSFRWRFLPLRGGEVALAYHARPRLLLGAAKDGSCGSLASGLSNTARRRELHAREGRQTAELLVSRSPPRRPYRVRRVASAWWKATWGTKMGEVEAERRRPLQKRRAPASSAVPFGSSRCRWLAYLFHAVKRGWPFPTAHDSYLVDSASSHMLVSKIKPCKSEYKHLYRETANGSLNQLSFI